jgi:hypothetical protein
MMNAGVGVGIETSSVVGDTSIGSAWPRMKASTKATGIRNRVAGVPAAGHEHVNIDNALDKLQRVLAETGSAPR